MLLLIGEAKYQFALGGEWRTLDAKFQKRLYRNEYSPPNNCVTHNVVDE